MKTIKIDEITHQMLLQMKAGMKMKTIAEVIASLIDYYFENDEGDWTNDKSKK